MFKYRAGGQESGVAKGLFYWLLGVLFSSIESSMFVRVSLIPVFLNIIFFPFVHLAIASLFQTVLNIMHGQ